jgi:hypothetical protein
MDANAWIALAGLGAAGTSAYLSSRQNRQNRDAAAEQAELDRDERKGTNLLEVASRESLADPFRQQLSQGNALQRLDMMARANYTPSKISVPPEMQRFVPQVNHGFSYTPNPDLQTAAKLLQRSIASGQTAPTMTDPANYGRTAALNLNDPRAPTAGAQGPMAPAPGSGGGAVPRTGGAAAPGAARTSTGSTLSNSYFAPGGAASGSPSYSTDERDMAMNLASGNPAFANYRRRREGAGGAGGGALKGLSYGSVAGPLGMAGGAAIGAIAGAFTKNAKTAMSDFYLDDAKQILRDQSEALRGRPATEEEIDEAIAGQGWKPGNRWVGQESLDYILQQWAQQGEQARGDAEDDEEFAPSYSGLFA